MRKNKSGLKGVAWYKRLNKWQAHLTLNGSQKFLGFFSDINDAIEARRLGELKYFNKDFIK